jgi:hypothetical protein
MCAASHFLDHLQGFWLFFSQGFASFPQLDQLVETKVFIFGKLLPLVKGQWHHHMKKNLKKFGYFAKIPMCIMSNIE